jgi:hypothetical protein
MQTHQIHVSGGRDHVHDIRNELFAFPEVLDVFVTGRPDVLVVVCAGRPRPAVWLRALRRFGYLTPARGRASWSRPQPRHEAPLSRVISPDVGGDEGNRTTSSIPNEQAPARRRDAA